MRKIIILLMILFCSVNLFGQNIGSNWKTVSNKQFVVFDDKTDISKLKVLTTERIEKIPGVKFHKNFKMRNIKWALIETEQLKDAKTSYSMPVFQTDKGSEVEISCFFYVRLHKEEDVKLLEKLATENNVEIVGNDKYMPLWYILMCTNKSKGNTLEMSNLFGSANLFKGVLPDILNGITPTCANTTKFNEHWNLKNVGQHRWSGSTKVYCTPGMDINICGAWEITKGNPNIKVAVIDNGVMSNHPDLPNVENGYDAEKDTIPSKVYGNSVHGLSCAGVIGSSHNNNRAAGIAPNCKILPISFNWYNDKKTTLYYKRLADGIHWAWKNGADVLSCSWAYDTTDFSNGYMHFITPIGEAVDSALVRGRNGKGCVVVFSSGNDDIFQDMYPAIHNSDIIVVGGISIDGKRKTKINPVDKDVSWGSNYGTTLDVMAPSVLIPTTGIDSTQTNFYGENFWGTSAACPHVAGVAALMLSVNPNLTQQEVKEIICQTANRVHEGTGFGEYNYQNVASRPNGGTWHQEMGHGLLDACAAVSKAAGINCGQTITHYYENICRSLSSGKFSRVILEAAEITEEELADAKWYIGGINTTPKKTGSGTFVLSDYLTANYNMNKVDVYLVLGDNVYHWEVSITEISELITEYYINNPVEGVTISTDGKFYIASNNDFVQIIPVPCNNLVISNLDEIRDKFAVVPKILITDDSSRYNLHYRLKDSECSATIKLELNCENCSEKFEFNVYNLSPKAKIVRVCSSGAKIEIENGGCAGLQTKWRKVGGNIIENSENSNSLEVIEAGVYNLEYYHPDDLNKPIYTFKVDVSIHYIFPAILALESSAVKNIDDKCYFTATIDIATDLELDNYKFFSSAGSRLSEQHNTEWSELQEVQLDNGKIVIDEQISCDTREYKITIKEYDSESKEVGDVACELLIPVSCNCNSCEEIENQMQTGYYYGNSASPDILIHQPRINPEKIKGVGGLICRYILRFPRDVIAENILLNGVNISIDCLYEKDGMLELNAMMTSPCKDNNDLWGSGTNTNTYEITIKRENADGSEAICTYTQVFQCECNPNPDVDQPYEPIDPSKYVVMNMEPIGGDAGGGGIIQYEDRSVIRVPLTFWLYDFNGTKLEPVYQLMPTDSPIGTFNFNITNYPSGIYFITAESQYDEIYGVVQFIKQ